MKNPCYNTETKTDCPERKFGCGATCPKWAEYVKLRDAEYECRHRENAKERYRISNYKGRQRDGKRKDKNR